MKKRDAVSRKISELVHEGFPSRQATAIAFSEQRAGKLGRKSTRTTSHKANPDQTREIAQAVKLYEKFSGHEAEVIDRIDKPEAPGVLVAIGEIDFIGYTTVRDGETQKYIHRFKAKARPLFCVSPDGKQIVLIGGSYDFTERGIVDKT